MIVSGGQALSITRLDGGRLADQVPLLGGATHYAQTALELSGRWAAYSTMYRTQPWVYTLVRKLAVSGSRLPIIVHERADDGSRPPVIGSPYGDLLSTPSSILDGQSFWLWVMSTVELYGEAILWKWRDENRRVRELFPLHPTNITVRRTDAGPLEYLYLASGKMSSAIPPIPQSDIVHFKTYNPDTPTRGLSWLEPLRQTLLTDDASRRAQAAQWLNGAKPSFALESPKELGDAAQKRIAAGWRALHSGVDNWAKTVILEEGMTARPLTMSADDMQYVQTRQLAREECCSVADVAPPVVHILDRATFSNITEQFRSMYRDTMAPRLALYESTLDFQLRPDFDPGATQRAAFDLNEVLAGSPEMAAAANAQMIQTGQMTPNEARAAAHRSPHPDGDRLVINAALIPLGTTVEAAPMGTDVVQGTQRVKAADVRRLMCRLGTEAKGDMTRVVNKAAILVGLSNDLTVALADAPEFMPAEQFRVAVKALELEE
jgi:HK97 family phage portal protein